MSINSKDTLVIDTILKSAQEQFHKYGLAKTTMNDIAKYAGKGKSTLYYYFTSKEEIFKSVILMEIEEMFTQVEMAVDNCSTGEEQFQQFFLTKLKLLKEKKNLCKFTFEKEDIAPLLGDFISKLDINYTHREETLIQRIIIKGINSGEFKFELDKVKLYSKLLTSCFRGVEFDVLINQKYDIPEKDIIFLTSIIIKGIS